MAAGAGRGLALALVLAVLWPGHTHGTCHEPALCGVCAGAGARLAVQGAPRAALPRRADRAAHPRRRGALALSAGLRKWLGLGDDGRQQDKWKQAVTEVNGPGLTDEEKLEAARVRRRALVVQDPAYRARLQKQGTLPVQVLFGPAAPPHPPARGVARLSARTRQRGGARQRSPQRSRRDPDRRANRCLGCAGARGQCGYC
jgi:hypothetical protein